ncbi:hypothetical protein [Maribacter spongiicola]|uniref:hypothetical protein n=1 Tax=Maribacter spongiicola TaxID=1206753 RepID=UPI001414D140|nr:hypothetical protein [Maribacter spongiicola]
MLTHSHVNEQPFTKSGSSILLKNDDEVYIRVHMNNSGYASTVQKEFIENGF